MWAGRLVETGARYVEVGHAERRRQFGETDETVAAQTRAARGGTFQQFGCAPDQETARFSPFRIYHDELRIVGSMAILHGFGRAVELLGKGVVDAETMITHRFGLDSYATALETFRRGTGRKLQIVPSGAAT
ncbi:Triosephosphate isomerase [Streptomyces noursei ATCC 11455]|nr:Triosephosphate isomerase [Streptomyces noursei ATCC 11455]